MLFLTAIAHVIADVIARAIGHLRLWRKCSRKLLVARKMTSGSIKAD
jgi:hypothetical protein